MPDEMGHRAIPQPPDVATGIVVTAVAGFLGFVALTMTGLFFYLRTGAPNALRQADEHQFPQPALQKRPLDDLQQFELEQRSALEGYGWVDRSNGSARIPIAEAMRIVAARGKNGYDAPVSPRPSNTGNPGAK